MSIASIIMILVGTFITVTYSPRIIYGIVSKVGFPSLPVYGVAFGVTLIVAGVLLS